MDIPEATNKNGGEPELEQWKPKLDKPISNSDIFDLNTWKRFFCLTGGSTFYCLSAVFTSILCRQRKAMMTSSSG